MLKLLPKNGIHIIHYITALAEGGSRAHNCQCSCAYHNNMKSRGLKSRILQIQSMEKWINSKVVILRGHPWPSIETPDKTSRLLEFFDPPPRGKFPWFHCIRQGRCFFQSLVKILEADKAPSSINKCSMNINFQWSHRLSRSLLLVID